MPLSQQSLHHLTGQAHSRRSSGSFALWVFGGSGSLAALGLSAALGHWRVLGRSRFGFGNPLRDRGPAGNPRGVAGLAVHWFRVADRRCAPPIRWNFSG